MYNPYQYHAIPRSGRSPGGGNGNQLQYSCLENSMDRGAWQATVHGVTKSQTRLKRLSSSSSRWLRRESVCLQSGRPGFNPWVGKNSWRRKLQPAPVFLPGKSHGWRGLVGYSPWGCKESDTTEQLHFTSRDMKELCLNLWGCCMP